MKFFRFYALFLLVLWFNLSIARRELVMISVLHRHGARYTLHGDLLVNDPELDDLIRNNAELTEAGMR
jgi:hypothetical protein